MNITHCQITLCLSNTFFYQGQGDWPKGVKKKSSSQILKIYFLDFFGGKKGNTKKKNFGK